jgi:ABC-type phosphate/phosphonate transport system substrate-binding protein
LDTGFLAISETTNRKKQLVVLWFEAGRSSDIVAARKKLPDAITQLCQRSVFTLANLSSHKQIISECDMHANRLVLQCSNAT